MMHNCRQVNLKTALWPVALVGLAGCTTLQSASTNTAVSYANPPVVNSVLAPWQRLITCSSIRGARHTAATGFYFPGCQAVLSDGKHRIMACTHIELDEGGMWLLEAATPGGSRVWIPLPWHDWA